MTGDAEYGRSSRFPGWRPSLELGHPLRSTLITSASSLLPDDPPPPRTSALSPFVFRTYRVFPWHCLGLNEVVRPGDGRGQNQLGGEPRVRGVAEVGESAGSCCSTFFPWRCQSSSVRMAKRCRRAVSNCHSPILSLSNRSQLRPPFRAQSRPLLGLIELRGMAFAGVGRLWVSGLPERPSEKVWGTAGHLSIADSEGVGWRGQFRFLKRQLVLPVSTMSQWCVRRSSMAVVILASPNI